MSHTRYTTLSVFAGMKGDVFAPVHITDDYSDHVKMVKKDLIDTLRHNGITHVRFAVDTVGNITYIEGIQGEFG